jgi:hypothetical protein
MADAVALKGKNGKYLSAKPDGKVAVDADEVGPNGLFVLTPNGEKANFQTANGKFLCVEPNGVVVANRDAAREWETFTLTCVSRTGSAFPRSRTAASRATRALPARRRPSK